MAHGHIDRDGTVRIEFNAQAEILPAPNGRVYLPCENCNRVQVVLPNTVAITCMPCVRRLVDEGRADPAWLAECERHADAEFDTDLEAVIDTFLDVEVDAAREHTLDL